MSALETVIKGAYELGGLGSTEEGQPFYLSRGWLRWEGPSYTLTLKACPQRVTGAGMPTIVAAESATPAPLSTTASGSCGERSAVWATFAAAMNQARH